MVTLVKSQSPSLLILLLVVSVLSLAGCGMKNAIKEIVGSPAPELKVDAPPAPKLEIQVEARDDANRGPGGKSLPVVVRVYELKGQGAFTSADFFALYDNESSALGADLIARDEVTLAPGQVLPIERDLDPQVAYLGVIAAFRDIDQSRWRELLPLRQGVNNRVLIEVGAKAVSVRHL